MVHDLSPISAENLAQRRRRLKKQRGWKVVQTIWRTLLLSGMATGMAWGMTLSFWVIRDPAQVEIEGNHLLSEDTLRKLLPLHYPLSLLQVQPQTLVTALETSSPVTEVSIGRQLFPPRLKIEVQERNPVAQATLAPDASGRSTVDPKAWGLLDERGVWMPLTLFTSLDSTVPLPALKVLGMREEFAQEWSQLYGAIRTSPVKITQVDWRDPNNLILQTELGIVHCGPFSSQFDQQLAVLDRMRQIAQYPEAKKIEYVDLSRPASPYLQMQQPGTPAKK
jgi:cell division protein FtsQ